MSAQPILNDLQLAGFELAVEGDRLLISPAKKLNDNLRHKIRRHKAELLAALKAEQIANRIEDFTELYEERAAIAEYDGGLSREQAEELAIKTAWRWVLSSGDGGTYRCTALTYEEAREHLEKQFLGRKVTNLEFISAMAEGHGFVPYQPKMGELKQ